MTLRFDAFQKSASLADQRQLFLDAFPETAGTEVAGEQHYSWKFHSFPAQPPSYEFAAWDGPHLVGYYAALPYKYRVFGRDQTIGMVCDVMTHSSMRGKGVFTKLGAYSLKGLAEAGFDFSTGYPIRSEVIPGHLKVGWQIAIELPLYLKVLRADGILAERKLGILAPAINFGLALYRKLIRTRRDKQFHASNLSIAELTAQNEYGQFLSDWRESVPISLEKSPDFLRWRLGAPGTTYRAIQITQDSKIVAIAIVRPTVLKGISTLAIVDVMILPQMLDSIGTLHHALEVAAFASGCDTISTMLSRFWAKRYRLVSNGFLRTPFIFKLILRALRSELPPNPSDESNWHLMWIDSDDV